MSWLQFISSIAWPVAALLIALIFRAQIASLLKRIEEIGWGDKTVKFNNDVKDLEKQVEAVEFVTPRIVSATATAKGKSSAGASGMAFDAAPESVRPVSKSDLAEEIRTAVELITVSPSAAVVTSWTLIEQAMERLAEEHGLAKDTTLNTAKSLSSRGVFPLEIVGTVKRLRSLRDSAADGEKVNTDGALRYIGLVSRVLIITGQIVR